MQGEEAVAILRSSGPVKDREYSLRKIRSKEAGEDQCAAEEGNAALIVCYDGEWTPNTSTEFPNPIKLTFVVGHNMALPWLEEAARGLRAGDYAHIICGSTVEKTVFMERVTEGSAGDASLSAAESAANELEKLRLRGNELLTGKDSGFRDWRQAVLAYNRALEWAPFTSDGPGAEVRLRLNLALAHLKLENWDTVVMQCDAILLLDKSSAKAYFRRGVASFNLQLGERAIADLREAKRLCPEDKRIAKELEHCVNKHYAQIQKHRQEFAQMYSKQLKGAIFDKQSTTPCE